MREGAKLIDSPVGVFLSPADLRREGPALVRAQGLRVAIGAVLRQIAAKYDPPLGRSANPVNANIEELAIRYHYTYELTKPDGVAPARRPVNDMDFALEVPFAFQPSVAHHGPVAAIIHAFYTDELDGLLRRLEGAPVGVDLFISTDTPEKKAQITAKYSFSQAFCLPYELNSQVSASLRPAPRERLILIYGRPSVSRNAFEIICAALHLWQQRDAIRASRWSIVFLGEDFETPVVYPVQNAVVAGKVSLDRYADYLSRATLGVSLMLSPHPSYPPLEMAEAGLTVIANNFGVKALEKRFPGIRLLDSVAPEAIAREIENAAAASEPLIGTIVARRHALPVEFPADRLADAGRIVPLLREAMRPVA